MKDLGPIEQFQGIKVTWNKMKGTLFLSQKKLVEEILQKFEMVNCKPISTLMTMPSKLSTNDNPRSIYCDTNHIDTSWSISRMVFTFTGATNAWRTRTQSFFTLSSIEAEYINATLTAKRKPLDKNNHWRAWHFRTKRNEDILH